jgi:thiamine kinase-like enzyme
VDEQTLIQLLPDFRDRPCLVTPLGGGLTNRNFRIDVQGESYVVRVAGRDTGLLGIDRGSELACATAAAKLGVAPEVVASLPDHGITVRRFVAGKVLAEAEVRQLDVMRRVVESLRRYHEGPGGGGRFSPFETVRRYHAVAQERGVSLPAILPEVLGQMALIECILKSDDPPCPCHNDLLAANFIDDGTTVQIIDWEYAGQGDRFFDLGNLAVNCEFNPEQERALLEFYSGEVRDADLRRLRLMRLASDMREAMWGFLQSAISSLDEDFVAYGRKHLDRFLNSPLSREFKGSRS